MNAAPSGRLPVIETVLQTYDMFAAYFLKSILHYIANVLLILALYVVAFHYVGQPDYRPDATPQLDEVLPFQLLMLSVLIPEMVLYIGMLRLGANGRMDRNHLFGLRWGHWENCVSVRSFVVFIIIVLVAIPLIVVGVLVLRPVLAAVDPLLAGGIVSLLALPLMYLVFRFFPYTCSPALDERIGLGQSWRLTRGNGLRILFISLLLYVPIVIANLAIELGLGLQDTIAGAIVSGMLAIVGMMFTGFGSAIVYRALVPRAMAEPTTNVAAR